MDKNTQERYDDLLFSILMERYMEEYGQQLQEEAKRLNKDPDFQLPENFRERNLATIEKAFKQQRRKEKRHAFWKVAQKVAVAIMACGFTLSILYCSVEAFRVKVNNLFIGAREEYASIINTNNADVSAENSLLPAWYPDGFTENIISADTTNLMVQYLSDTNPDESITYYTLSETPESSVQTNLDMEDIDSFESTELLGFDAWWVTKGEKLTLVWIDNINYARCVITAISVDRETVVRMAESIYR